MLLPFYYAPISIKICGLGSVVIAAHEALLPSVVKYLPELLAWAGNESTVAQDDVVPLVVRYLPEFDVWLGTTYVVESVATKVLEEGIVVPFIVPATVALLSVGVTIVGLVFITKVEPVPVWAATLVAEPIEVIGPVRLLGETDAAIT